MTTIWRPLTPVERAAQGETKAPDVPERVLLQGVVTAVDGTAMRATVAMQGDDPNPVPGVRWMNHVIPQVGDAVWLERYGGVPWIRDSQAFPPGALAHEVNTQYWSGTFNHTLATSYQFVGSSETLTITKRFTGTRLVGTLHLAFNNPNAAPHTFFYALYATGGAGGDGVGQWEVCRNTVDTGSRGFVGGVRDLGVAGRYPAGSLTFAVAAKAEAAVGMDTTAAHSWGVEVEEVW